MSKFNLTADVETKVTVKNVTIMLNDAESIERFKELLTDSSNYGPETVREMAREMLNTLSDRERFAVSPTKVLDLDVVAAQSDVIRVHMENQKKILAIKELRALTNCGLKEAKDAVERAYPQYVPNRCSDCGGSLNSYRSWAQCPHNAHNHSSY